MSEVLFYHLETANLEDALPGLLERTRERGWRAVLRVGSAERMAALDTHLWTYSEQSFLAHGTAAEGHKERQPIFLTVEDENPNRAEVLFLVGGAMPEDWASPRLTQYTRIVLMFDGRDSEALGFARVAWKDAKASGHEAAYWKQSPSGKWEKQA
jgi:DNA polymerase III subunit chi